MRGRSLALAVSLALLLPLMLTLSLLFSGPGTPPSRLLAQVNPSDTPEPTDTPEPPEPTDVPWVPPYFQPYDGREDPKPGDRVAVYCYGRWREIEVWGIDNQSQGILLYTFDFDDTYNAGSRGLSISVPNQGTVSLVVDGRYNFLVSWDGPLGTFSKAFYCDFSGPTPTYRPGVGRMPTVWAVVTVTPAPSLTPYPTQRLY